MWGYRSPDGNERALIGKLHSANDYLQAQTKTGGVQTESGNISSTQSEWATYEIARETSKVKYFIDDALVHTETSNVPAGTVTLKVGGTTHSESGNFRIDWGFIRKYIDIEPVFSSAGIETVSPEVLDNMSLDIQAYQRALQNSKTDVSAYYQSTPSVPIDILVYGFFVEDSKIDAFCAFQELVSFPLAVQGVNQNVNNFRVDLHLTPKQA